MPASPLPRTPFRPTAGTRSGIAATLAFGICLAGGWILPCCVQAEVQTSFQDSTLNANLHLDIPNPDVGTITLDTVNQSLLFHGTGADLWNDRNGLPYAWTDIPQVGVGGVWRAETEVTYNVAEHQWGRIAGMTTYSGPDGSGGAWAGQEFTFGLDQWDGPNGVWVQGLGDNYPGDSNNLYNELITDTVDLRMEVTVGDWNYNTYDFYYKLAADETWTALGTIHNASSEDRVALFFKGDVMDVSFNYFNVTTVSTTVPEPGALLLAALGAAGLMLGRSRKRS